MFVQPPPILGRAKNLQTQNGLLQERVPNLEKSDQKKSRVINLSHALYFCPLFLLPSLNI